MFDVMLCDIWSVGVYFDLICLCYDIYSAYDLKMRYLAVYT